MFSHSSGGIQSVLYGGIVRINGARRETIFNFQTAVQPNAPNLQITCSSMPGAVGLMLFGINCVSNPTMQAVPLIGRPISSTPMSNSLWGCCTQVGSYQAYLDNQGFSYPTIGGTDAAISNITYNTPRKNCSLFQFSR